jgi:hypothetical protein
MVRYHRCEAAPPDLMMQMAATNVRAMDLLMTLGGLYLFASLAALLAGVVVRVLTTSVISER